MQGEDKERWQVLCEQAVKEQDAVKLFALIQEVNRLLEAKEARLKEARKQPADSDSGQNPTEPRGN